MDTGTNQNKRSNKLNLSTLTGSFVNPEEVVQKMGVSPGDKVADFGCGNGFFSIPMARAVGEKGKIYAIDVMATPLEAVRSRAYLNGLNNVVIIRADLERKNSLDEKIENGDCQQVFIANALCQAKKKKTLLSVAKRVLAAKGQLLIVEWKKDVNAAFSNFGPDQDLRLTEERLKKLVVEAGFKFIERFDAGEFHFGMKFKKK